MPTPNHNETVPDEMLANERDIRAKLGDRPFDFDSLHVISNIYRAAAAIRRRAEREVLSDYSLSWGGFTILWVLWIWGEMETANLAAECDLAKGTLTGMVSTLEQQGLVERERMASDRRRVTVSLTDEGRNTIEEVFPAFNAFEADMSANLDTEEKRLAAGLLRRIITRHDEPS